MSIKILLLDVGGVLLSNGWDYNLRKKAATVFGLDFDDMQNLHEMVFEDYERGRITLDDYVQHVVFFKPQSFSVADFQAFMFAQTRPNLAMMELIETFKRERGVKIACLSNEGKELAVDRFRKFPFFRQCVDSYIVSGFVNMRKPDLAIYQLALGVVQESPHDVLYIDDRKKNLAPALALGMHAIHHVDYATTAASLQNW